jgi:hypothetical protein
MEYHTSFLKQSRFELREEGAGDVMGSILGKRCALQFYRMLVSGEGTSMSSTKRNPHMAAN